MARTIGRRWPYKTTRGDSIDLCSHCGAEWPRSKLRREATGSLACPDEGRGRDMQTLSDMNAAAARSLTQSRTGGRSDQGDDP